MIYLTGDTHNTLHVNNLLQFKQKMQEDDIVIQLGDFGFPWTDEAKELRVLEKLNDSPGLLLFIDGNHENFEKLLSLPTKMEFGAEVGVLREKIWHLRRFGVFTINNYKFWALGGGLSIDQAIRTENIDWWPQEMPTTQELYDLLDNLPNVDYILSHEVPAHLLPYKSESKLAQFFSVLYEQIAFKQWYCAHIHQNMSLSSVKLTCLFNRIEKLVD